MYVDRKWFAKIILAVIDGLHRTSALRNTCNSLMSLHDCGKDDPRVKKHRFARVIIYAEKVVDNLTMLSKAVNTQTSVCVTEDNHEKLTMVVALHDELQAKNKTLLEEAKSKEEKKALKKSLTATALATYMLGRANAPMALSKRNGGQVMQYTGLNYNSMWCAMAIALRGEFLDWMSELLDEASKEQNKVRNSVLFVTESLLD